MTTAKPMPISIRIFLSRFIVFPPLGQTDYRKSILGNDWFSIRISLKTKSSAIGDQNASNEGKAPRRTIWFFR